jgi:hypothetical protein
MDPRTPGLQQLPAWSRNAGGWEISFTRPDGVDGITYGAEWSETMRDGEWYPADDLSSGNLLRFRVPPAVQPNLFLRMRVADP